MIVIDDFFSTNDLSFILKSFDDSLTWTDMSFHMSKYGKINTETPLLGIRVNQELDSLIKVNLLRLLADKVPNSHRLFFHIAFHKWGIGCGANMHNDGLYKATATIYLNEHWDPSWGGMFVWVDKDGVEHTVCPKRNRLVLGLDSYLHAVTEVNGNALENRLSIQVFMK